MFTLIDIISIICYTSRYKLNMVEKFDFRNIFIIVILIVIYQV